MHDKIRAAFDEIHAEEDLKAQTRTYLARKAQGRHRRSLSGRMRLVPALACCLLVLLAGWGGYHTYFTPSAIISIDVNPSLELGVNRFDKVVSVEGYNEDGAALADAVDVKYMDYTQALTRILDSDTFAPYTSEDAAISIAVFGSDEQKSSEMLSQVQACTAGYRNTHCYADNMEVAAAAHAAGLSCGKYRAYLELHELDPSVTPEDIQGMTMREIRDRIASLSGTSDAGQAQETGTSSGSGHHGNGAGNGKGKQRHAQGQQASLPSDAKQNPMPASRTTWFPYLSPPLGKI